MPFYEYACKNCHVTTEVLQKISDPPLKKCPHCGKAKLEKLVSAASFHLKGGGWYVTDFKDPPKDKQAKGEATVASGDTGSTKKEEVKKPEAKPSKAAIEKKKAPES